MSSEPPASRPAASRSQTGAVRQPRNGRRPHLVLISLFQLTALGLRAVQALLRRHGFEATIIFYEGYLPRERANLPRLTRRRAAPVLALLARLQPDLVGLSVFTPYLPVARELTRLIKAELRLPVIWGGAHATLDPRGSLDSADLVCDGESEPALPTLMAAIAGGQTPAQAVAEARIPNLWIRGPGGEPWSAGRERFADLDALPFPDFSDDGCYFVTGQRIHERWPFTGYPYRNFYNVQTARGCPYQCSYCMRHLEHERFPGQPRVRRRSVDNVMRELARARRANPDLSRVIFWDDVFLMHREWLREFAARYPSEVGLPFSAQAHPSALDEETLGLAVQAGLAEIAMGIQAGPRLATEVFDRPYRAEDLLAAARLIRSFGFEPTYDIIQGNPLASEADHRELFELLLRIPGPFRLNTHDLYFFAGYRLTELAQAEGVIAADVTDPSQRHRFVWDGLLSPLRSRQQLRWDGVFYLMGQPRVPRRIVRAVGHSRIFGSGARLFTLPLFFYDRGSRALAGLLGR